MGCGSSTASAPKPGSSPQKYEPTQAPTTPQAPKTQVAFAAPQPAAASAAAQPAASPAQSTASALPSAPSLSALAEELFAEVDTNGTGTLTRSELRAKIAADGRLEALLGADDIKKMSSIQGLSFQGLFGTHDADGDTQLSIEEFKACVGAIRAAKCFSAADVDQDGKLSRAEIRAKIKADSELEALLGIADLEQMSSLSTSASSFQGLFGAADADGDKKISLDELLALLDVLSQEREKEKGIKKKGKGKKAKTG